MMKEKYLSHLGLPQNHFTILSGKYGTGKTYFLNQFFETYRDDYVGIFISPLKYQINSSENIFELIKLDIIRQFFRRGFISPQAGLSDELWREIEGGKMALSRMQELLRQFPKVDPFRSSGSIAMEGLIQNLKGEEREVKSMVARSRKRYWELDLALFLEDKYREKGQFGELDDVTYAINQVIEAENNRHRRRWVLIIDDFDRLDPDHLFRVLNVFSAHQDEERIWKSKGLGNAPFKFFFDHVVLVCDYGSLRNLYHFKYGERANFKGYIDKFVSREVFHFSQAGCIQTLFFDLCREEWSVPEKRLIAYLLGELVASGVLNIRHLAKVERTHWNVFSRASRMALEKPEGVIRLIPILSIVFGSFLDFKQALEQTKVISPLSGQLSFKEIIDVLHLLVREILKSRTPFLKTSCGDLRVSINTEGLRISISDSKTWNFGGGLVEGINPKSQTKFRVYKDLGDGPIVYISHETPQSQLQNHPLKNLRESPTSTRVSVSQMLFVLVDLMQQNGTLDALIDGYTPSSDFLSKEKLLDL